MEVGIAVALVLVEEVVANPDVIAGAEVGFGVEDDRLELLLPEMVVANIVEPEIVVGAVKVVTMKLPENPPVPSGLSIVNVMSISGETLRVIGTAAATTAASARSESTLRLETSAEASWVRRDCPSKVTNAFSVLQERLSLLNLDCIKVATRGTEKLV